MARKTISPADLIYPPAGQPLKETRSVDYKGSFDISEKRDLAEIAKDVAAMANTIGGHIVFGVDKNHRRKGLPAAQAAAVTPEDFDNKISEYLDPRVETTIHPITIKSRLYTVIEVAELNFPPCVMKREGTYPHGNKTKSAFKKGDVFVRHGAKSESANRGDFMRMFDKTLAATRKEWFRNIRQLTTAPLGSEILVRPRGTGLRLTTDPAAPAIRGLVDTEKFGTLNEELTGAVKLWKTDPNHRISEPRLMKMYAERDSLHLDSEAARLLVESALTHRAPACYWASKLDRRVLKRILRRAVQSNTQIGREALSLVVLLGGKWGRRLLQSASNSDLISIRNRAMQLQPIIGLRLGARMNWFVHQPPRVISYRLGGNLLSADVDSLVQTKGSAGEVATALASDLEARNAVSGAKQALKRLDVALYGVDI